MIIGAKRVEECLIYDSHDGYHSFHDEDGGEYGSFEVFFDACRGWLWHSCFPGCLPDGEVNGPFPTSLEAAIDADPDNPEFADYFEE